MIPECDPCRYCRCLYDYSDPSVEWVEEGCRYFESLVEGEYEWEPGCGRPCRGFTPIFSSDELMHEKSFREASDDR